MCVTEGLQDYNRFWNECKVLKKRHKMGMRTEGRFFKAKWRRSDNGQETEGEPRMSCVYTTLYIWLPHKVTRGLCNILPTSIKDEGWTWKFFIPISFKLTLLLLFQPFPSNPVLGSRMSNLSRPIFFWSFACSQLIFWQRPTHPPICFSSLVAVATQCFPLLSTHSTSPCPRAPWHIHLETHTRTHTRMQHMHTLW